MPRVPKHPHTFTSQPSHKAVSCEVSLVPTVAKHPCVAKHPHTHTNRKPCSCAHLCCCCRRRCCCCCQPAGCDTERAELVRLFLLHIKEKEFYPCTSRSFHMLTIKQLLKLVQPYVFVCNTSVILPTQVPFFSRQWRNRHQSKDEFHQDCGRVSPQGFLVPCLNLCILVDMRSLPFKGWECWLRPSTVPQFFLF